MVMNDGLGGCGGVGGCGGASFGVVVVVVEARVMLVGLYHVYIIPGIRDLWTATG